MQWTLTRDSPSPSFPVPEPFRIGRHDHFRDVYPRNEYHAPVASAYIHVIDYRLHYLE